MNRIVRITGKAILLCVFFSVGFFSYSIYTWVRTPNTNILKSAQEQKINHVLIETKGLEIGLNCITSAEECKALIERAHDNPRLMNAFLKAKSLNVSIHPARWWEMGPFTGSIHDGYVKINIDMSDERIIAFLKK